MPPSLFEALEIYGADPQYSDLVHSFKALLTETESPFSRNQFPGHITASCFVVNPQWSQILLLKHKKLEKWLQMGGHCDGEANTCAVALREAQEETGSEAIRLFRNEIIDLDIHVIPARKTEPQHLHYDVRYLGVCDFPEKLKKSEAECTDLAWFSWEEAYRVAEEASMHRVFKKITALKELGEV